MAKTLREQIEVWSRWDGFPSWARREFQQALTLPDTVQPEDVRKRFEKWFGQSFPDDHSFEMRSDGRYSDSAVRCAWAGYNAALTTAPEVTGGEK